MWFWFLLSKHSMFCIVRYLVFNAYLTPNIEQFNTLNIMIQWEKTDPHFFRCIKDPLWPHKWPFSVIKRHLSICVAFFCLYLCFSHWAVAIFFVCIHAFLILPVIIAGFFYASFSFTWLFAKHGFNCWRKFEYWF